MLFDTDTEMDVLWEKADDFDSESSPIRVTFTDPAGYYQARAKWDGCIELYRYFNEPLSENEDYINQLHICDIDNMIIRLQALKKKAIEHFGEWPG